MPELTITDVLISIIHLLPVREEATLVAWLTTIENSRPALDKLVSDAKADGKTLLQDSEKALKDVGGDVENLVKGL